MEILAKLLRGLLPTTWVKWIDGYKTVIGLFGCIVCVILPMFNVPVPEQAMKFFELLIGVGIAHKVEKLKADAKQMKDDLSADDEKGA
jgi:hypothetical protein